MHIICLFPSYEAVLNGGHKILSNSRTKQWLHEWWTSALTCLIFTVWAHLSTSHHNDMTAHKPLITHRHTSALTWTNSHILDSFIFHIRKHFWEWCHTVNAHTDSNGCSESIWITQECNAFKTCAKEYKPHKTLTQHKPLIKQLKTAGHNDVD